MELMQVRQRIIANSPRLITVQSGNTPNSPTMAHFSTSSPMPIKNVVLTLPYSSSGYSSATLQHTGVNLLHCEMDTYNAGGITVTGHRNSDNEIEYYSISGTSTKSSNQFMNLNYVSGQLKWPPYYGNYVTNSYSDKSNIWMVANSSPIDDSGVRGTQAGMLYYSNLKPTNSGAEWIRIQLIPYNTLNINFTQTLYPMVCLKIDRDCSFEPYKGHQYTLTFPTTIYGGTVDFITGQLISSYAADGTAINPTSYELSTQSIKTLIGVNNMWSLSGQLSVSYWTYNKTDNDVIYIRMPIYMDNAYFTRSNGKVNDVVENPNYCIIGPFDTGNSNNKTYTFWRICGYGIDTAWRIYDDINENSVDWWTATWAAGTSVEVSATTNGRYIFYSIYKPMAAHYYLKQDDTYIFKGSI